MYMHLAHTFCKIIEIEIPLTTIVLHTMHPTPCPWYPCWTSSLYSAARYPDRFWLARDVMNLGKTFPFSLPIYRDYMNQLPCSLTTNPLNKHSIILQTQETVVVNDPTSYDFSSFLNAIYPCSSGNPHPCPHICFWPWNLIHLVSIMSHIAHPTPHK